MTLSLPWLSNLFFISIRLGTILLFTPIQAMRQLPIHARLLFIFTLSLLMANYLPHSSTLNNIELALGGLAEFTNGLMFATSIYACFAIFQIAGHLIDNEIGLGAATLFNPGEHHQESLTSHLLTMLAVLFFFGCNGQKWLFIGFVQSFVLIPPGTLNLFTGLGPIAKQFSFMLSMAFIIASPIIIALLAIDLCSALMTRNMPQISAYFLIMPIKILLGFFLLFSLLIYLNPLMDRVFSELFHTWQVLLS